MHDPAHHPECCVPPDKADAWRLWAALFRTMHLQRSLMVKKLSEHGTHPGQAACLREIGHNDGLTQRDLARALHITRPAVTVMLQKMERAGLISRTPDATDQRLMRLHLTEKGSAKHLEMHDLLGEVIDATVSRLSDEEQSELARLLGKLADSFDAAVAEAGDAPTPEEVAVIGVDTTNHDEGLDT